MILTLVSDIASDYFTLLQLDLQLQITRQTVSTQTDSVKLTNLRLDHGVATKLDVLQAQQVLDTANAQIPDLERQIAQEENAISILLGDYPHDVARGLPWSNRLCRPKCHPAFHLQSSSDGPIFERRSKSWSPRMPKSESPRRSSFPQISLTGSGGGSFGRSSAFSSLMASQVGIWSYGAQVSQPIFTGGALRGNLRLAKSENQQALIAYRQTIQRAFGDVSDALIGYEKLHRSANAPAGHGGGSGGDGAHLQASLQRWNDDLPRGLGRPTFTLFGAELTLASARGDEYRSLVQLYKALGGGWQQ